MIDLHCHVLAGIDDGPKESEGSLALARRAAEVGIGTLVATPHVNRRYDNRAASIAQLVSALNTRLAAERIDVQVLAGAEVALLRAVEIEPTELERLRLGDGPFLLLEAPTAPTSADVEAMVRSLQERGHGILLAHPERCAPFHRQPRMLASLVRSCCLVSVTAGSLVGEFGAPVRRFALELVREGLAHNVVSDAHDAIKRPPGLREPLGRAHLAPLTEWLTEQVPSAILAGEQIPARPVAPARPARRPALSLRRLTRAF